MKRSKFIKCISYFTTIMMSSLLALAACTKPEQEHEPEPEPKPEPAILTLELSATAEATVIEAEITASTDTLGYYASIIPADEYTYDSKLLERDKTLFETQAQEEGKTVEEIIGSSLLYGSQSVSFNGLTPGIKYIVYAYQLDESSATGDVQKAEAETVSEFAIEIREITGSTATVVVTPVDKEQIYYLNIVPKADVEKYESEEEFMKAHIEENKPVLAYLVHKDDITLSWQKLYPESGYYAIVFGISTETAEATTPLYKFGFETPALSEAFTITLDIDQLTSVNIGGYTIPSMTMVNYVRGIMTKSSYESRGANMELVQQQLDSTIAARMELYGKTKQQVLADMTAKGKFPFAFSNLNEETEYVIWATVINSEGTVITEPGSAEFTTKSASKADGSIQLTYTTFYDGDDYYEDNSIYGARYKGKFIMQMRLHDKTEDIENWRLKICGGDLSDKSESELLGIVLNSSRKNLALDKDLFLYEEWSLAEDNDGKCTILLVGLDNEDRPTDIIKLVKDVTKDNASPIEEFYEASGSKH